ncbi:MAG: alpha/beta hydrolase [Bacteroidales bacterium]|jgi:acetyl esterase/lipase|nr:alpha/beta hydrolase [Bacteroidales bacterium]
MKKTIICVILVASLLSLSILISIKIWERIKRTRKQKWSELFVFLPIKKDSKGISVIICPGGSYYWLDMNNEGFVVAKELNKQGIPAFVLKYRTAKQGCHYPDMYRDLENAMNFLKDNNEKYGINPNKIGIMGFSAGGHLAGMAAIYSAAQLKPYFTAMIYPVVSMDDSIVHKKSRKNLLGNNYTDELKYLMSLEKNVHANLPPIFLLHCIGDKTVDYRNSVVFENALIEHNVKYKFLLIDESRNGGHGFGIKPVGKATGWIFDFLNFINNL